VAPSRELARQIMDVVDKMGEFTPVTKFFASKGAQFKGKNIDAQVIVGTPGTVIDVRFSRVLYRGRQREVDFTLLLC
jgi:ATP-dependent RNA helicase DDX19/DBP5